jgi:glucosamine--fructose-6-phosphate aminotransferase (isomerizing)
VLHLRAGEERAVAATKTYVASLAVVAGLVARLAEGTPWAAGLERLPGTLATTLETAGAWLRDAGGACVRELARADEALVVSRGHNFATALEVALKLKETSRIFADGYSTADLLHGPVAVAGPELPTLAFGGRARGRGRRAAIAGGAGRCHGRSAAGGRPTGPRGRPTARAVDAAGLRPPGYLHVVRRPGAVAIDAAGSRR